MRKYKRKQKYKFEYIFMPHEIQQFKVKSHGTELKLWKISYEIIRESELYIKKVRWIGVNIDKFIESEFPETVPDLDTTIVMSHHRRQHLKINITNSSSFATKIYISVKVKHYRNKFIQSTDPI